MDPTTDLIIKNLISKETQLAQSGTRGLGNTLPTPVRARRWTLTWNNYSEEDYRYLLNFAKENTVKYILGRETGTKNTPHIQGYLNFRNPRSFKNLKEKFSKIHLEKARGNDEQNFIYCSKENNYDSNFQSNNQFTKMVKHLCLKEYDGVIWKTWQNDIINNLSFRPSKRQINWYWDFIGNTGKSFLCKYLCLTYPGVVIADGKKDNIFNQVNNCLLHKVIPKLIILDIPRTNIDYINYGVIEKLKDGCIYSGKYEGAVCIFPHPFVYIFANEKPEKNKISQDRWNIVNIK